ncbi:oligopeptide transporter 4-like protein [Corchorus olitorius]|uniref:Oligopeptide transporter 4-like protein n=1 Tax=Corchorus olitorius TaxID=93759 RepID=A0A1R3KAP5_9ROSI|nr:oligopeptide transporter 4-like protein [Corchorus olitorius]
MDQKAIPTPLVPRSPSAAPSFALKLSRSGLPTSVISNPAFFYPKSAVWTFRIWFLGLLSCALLSFLSQLFSYRTEPLITLPVDHFMSSVLPKTQFKIRVWVKKLFLIRNTDAMFPWVLMNSFNTHDDTLKVPNARSSSALSRLSLPLTLSTLSASLVAVERVESCGAS